MKTLLTSWRINQWGAGQHDGPPVPPQMMGIMRSNVGENVEKAANVFVRNELLPLQKRIGELNTWLGECLITFHEYTL